MKQTTYRALIFAKILMLDSLLKIGAVHHDIKPDNILVSNDGHLALADFSVGRLVEDGHEPMRNWVPWYAAPEHRQAELHNTRVGHPADVWSIGICLLEMYCHSTQSLIDTGRFTENQTTLADDVREMAVMHYLRGHNPVLWDLLCKASVIP